MGRAQRAVLIIVVLLIVFSLGVSGGLAWSRMPSMQFENRMDWVGLLGFIGAVLNALVVLVVAIAISEQLAQRTLGRRFEKDLIVGFGKSALQVGERIDHFFHDCVSRKQFSDADRHQMVQLFAALAQEIHLAEESAKMCDVKGTVDAAQLCRGEYKDALTDHQAGTEYSAEEIKCAGIKYAALRAAVVKLIINVNRSK